MSQFCNLDNQTVVKITLTFFSVARHSLVLIQVMLCQLELPSSQGHCMVDLSVPLTLRAPNVLNLGRPQGPKA